MRLGSNSNVVDRRFVLESERGRGGMGTVWRATDLETGRPVALKVLHDDNPEQLERFSRESTLVSRLSHPGIVSYVAHGIAPDGAPYLAMEWLEGENVAERLARQPLTLTESLALLRSSLRGLSVAHAHGVVHRDIKPSNLFLRQGQVGDVVLLDLGLARDVSDARNLTRSGSVLGTPGYMAPEQAQARPITPASDVFSLGCLAFECLTGAPPFVSSQVYAVLAKLLFEPAPRLSSARPELPEALDALLARMLEKDPARRYADGSAVLAALDALGSLSEAAPPREHLSVPRASRAEQELVSVVLAARVEAAVALSGDSTLVAAASEPDLPSVALYGGELERLADGSAVIVLSQRGGAATDLAARAARCALRLSSLCPQFCFVIATGRGIRDLLQQRPPHGAQEAGSVMILGEAVERAGTMLRALTEENVASIWLDEVTANLLDARFQVAPKADGLVVFVLESEEPSLDVARPLLGRPTTCVGRDRELGMLELTLNACVDELEPRALLVHGPPGIGKSRLRHEFLRRAQRDGEPFTVLLGLGDPLRTSGSLIGSAIARWCGIRPEDSAEQSFAALAARAGRHLGEDRQLTLTFIAELCGLEPPGPPSPELRAAQQNPDIMSARVSRAWTALLAAEARARPVIIVLDDLQWSDPRSVTLAGVALRELSGAPFMLLALGRPETLDVFPDLWAPRLTTLPLLPLPQRATEKLVRQVLGEGVSADTMARIINRAGGNALYLEELIRATDARRDRVPETVLAMLQARIGVLPARERRVLRAASVFGEYFPRAGVDAVLAASGDSAELDTALAALARHEILERHEGEPSGRRWRFRHALMRDAAYALLTPEDLREAHCLAAEFLMEDGEDPAVIATHAERGGNAPVAIRHFAIAAQHAYQRNDLAGVVAFVARGVACGASGEALGVLRSIEAPALFYQHDFAAGWAASKEALELLPLGHPRRLASLAANTFAGAQIGKVDPSQRDELLAATPRPSEAGEYASSLGYFGIVHTVMANREEAQQALSRLLEVYAMLGEEEVFARGHVVYWQLRYIELLGDDPYQCYELAKRATAYNERAANRRMLAVSMVEIGELARRIGDAAEGERVMREALREARDVAEPISWAFVQQYLVNFLAEQGSDDTLDEALSLADEVVAMSGDGHAYRAFALTGRSLIHLRRGDGAKALSDAREAQRLLYSIKLRSYCPHADIAVLRVLLAQGDTQAAVECADAALALLEPLAPLGVIEPALRLWAARAHLAAGRPADAARGAHEGMKCVRRRSFNVPEARRAQFFSGVWEHAALAELERELCESAP